MLTTVFYPYPDDETGYIKATVRMRNVQAMLKMGWFITQEEAQAGHVDATEPTDPKVGDGEPGSPQWHENALKGMESKEEIEQYVREVCGKDLDKRGSIDTVRDKAMELING